MDGEGKRVRLRCPRCKRQNLYVESAFTDVKGFEVVNGGITLSYITGAMPDHISTDAKCNDCGHKWHVRQGESWSDQAKESEHG